MKGKVESPSASNRARVLVVDDHPIVRTELAHLINEQSDLVCCGQAATVPETLSAVASQKPVVVLLELRLGGGDGLELIKSLKAQFAGLAILIFSLFDGPLYVERALRAGALGYIVKDQPAEEVLKAIRMVLAGEVYLMAGMTGRLLRRFVAPAPNACCKGIERLTDRELHVLLLLGAGMSTREIATELHLSIKTIETHRESIKRKLEIQTASGLVHYASEWAREHISLPSEAASPAHGIAAA